MILPYRHWQEDFALRIRALNDIRCWVVVAVAGLAGSNRAAAGAGQRDSGARERAGSTSAECHW